MLSFKQSVLVSFRHIFGTFKPSLLNPSSIWLTPPLLPPSSTIVSHCQHFPGRWRNVWTAPNKNDAEFEPCDEGVEEDESNDWKDYVEDGGEPQHVDVQVPESIWCYGDMVIWWYGDMVIWWYGDMKIDDMTIDDMILNILTSY